MKTIFQALPPYFGGKRRLCRWIFTRLAQVVPVEEWPQLTFIDAFLGGGAASLYAKAQGFHQIIANDCAFRSYVVGQALLVNQGRQISEMDFLWLGQPLPKERLVGSIEEKYSPSVFSTRHAQALDQWLYWARQKEDPTQRALLLLLCWHAAVNFVSFGTCVNQANRPMAEALDGVRSWDRISPKRFLDGSIQTLLEPTMAALKAKRMKINRGIVGGTPAQVFQQDVFSFLRAVRGDMVYLDPPYAGTQGYIHPYRVIDTLLEGRELSTETTKNPFSQSTDSLHELLDACEHIPVWVLSYGGNALDLEGLTQLVRQHAGRRRVMGYSTPYRYLPHVSSPQGCQEFLIIAGGKDPP